MNLQIQRMSLSRRRRNEENPSTDDELITAEDLSPKVQMLGI